ncbi:MAG TPA: nicotinate phosphoribosyltransferase [Candidatus Bathyarchaeia archaeon]|nr:nicotinate phosphoribosyltransferase [Candidatus Bathyarchaeia archaeon]
MRTFHTASDDEIKRGETTDIYFVRTKEVLEAKRLDEENVVAEVTTSGLPESWHWGVLCGVEECLKLLAGLPINVYSMPEGSVFFRADMKGVREPIMMIEGAYGPFCVYETAMLGFLCQTSGVATMAARIRKIVGDKLIIAFGCRRMHPALAPVLDRASYIGGFDTVSTVAGAKLIDVPPMGTMPHSLIIMFGDQVKAWKAFDEVIMPNIPRVALTDTFFDEKAEVLMAAEALGPRLYGVRLDTPGSRRGNLAEIVREIRWELDIRGYMNVKIFASGGLNDRNIKEIRDAGVDGFGVGTSVSNAPTIDLGLDIVEVEGSPRAKRGKIGGKKQVWRCEGCMEDLVQLFDKLTPKCPKCGGKMVPMLRQVITNGKVVAELLKPQQIRDYVLRQLDRLSLEEGLL